MYDIKGTGAIFRSQVNWFEKDEKPTKYFFNLQKKNFEKRIITQLKVGDEEILSDFKQVNNEIENLYSEFYKSTDFESLNKGEVQEKFIAFVDGLDITRLSNDESEELDYELSIAEIRNALGGFQNNKTPGDDGFTKEFYEAFSDLLGNALLDSFNAAFSSGRLSVSQR